MQDTFPVGHLRRSIPVVPVERAREALECPNYLRRRSEIWDHLMRRRDEVTVGRKREGKEEAFQSLQRVQAGFYLPKRTKGRK